MTRPPLRRIEIGDLAPTMKLPDGKGANIWAYDTHLAGGPLVIFVFRDATSTDVQDMLQELKNRHPEYVNIGARIAAVCNLSPDETAAFSSQQDLPFPLMSDAQELYPASFGMTENNDECACAVFDRNSRMLAFLPSSTTSSAVDAAFRVCADDLETSPDNQIFSQAPVLLLPRVFEPDFCEKMIDYWRQGDKAEDQITRRATGNQKNTDYNKMKRRTDVLVPEGNNPVNQEISRRLSMRVTPELEKVFNHKSTRYELARVGCYESSKKGFFRAHRDLYHGDNVTPRRFAMSLNLNEGFEGGDVRFPEYGRQTYRAPVGGALIFSCRLLHEVVPVTVGKRYALFLFFN